MMRSVEFGRCKLTVDLEGLPSLRSHPDRVVWDRADDHSLVLLGPARVPPLRSQWSEWFMLRRLFVSFAVTDGFIHLAANPEPVK